MYVECGDDFDYEAKDWFGWYEFLWVEDGEKRVEFADDNDARDLYNELFNRLDDEDFFTLSVKRKRD